MENALQMLKTFGLEELPRLLIPIAILAIGWVIALIASALVRGALRRTKIDERIAERIHGDARAEQIDTAGWIGKAVYYTVLLFTLLAFLQATEMTAAAVPLNAMLGAAFAFLPRLVAALAIFFVGWLLATLVRKSLAASFKRWGVDRRFAKEAGLEPSLDADDDDVAHVPPVGRAVSETAYWLTLALFVPAVLGALELTGLLAPFSGLVERVLGFLPNLASAGLILVVGWLLAKVGGRLATGFFATVGVDRLSTRIGLDKAMRTRKLSSMLGMVVYAIILIPVAIGALDALQLGAITRPASRMLGSFLDALPMLFGAAVILTIAYAVGRLLSNATSALLETVGFDNILLRLGLAKTPPENRTYAPSVIVGRLVLVAVMLFATIEGARMLAFDLVADMTSDFTILGGRVLLGLLIFGLSLYLAEIASTAVKKSEFTQASIMSVAARVSVIVLGSAIALRQMGIADEIIELAFGLALGAIAVAWALAFGLGGRAAAGTAIEQFRGRARNGTPGGPKPAHARDAGVGGGPTLPREVPHGARKDT